MEFLEWSHIRPTDPLKETLNKVHENLVGCPIKLVTCYTNIFLFYLLLSSCRQVTFTQLQFLHMHIEDFCSDSQGDQVIATCSVEALIIYISRKFIENGMVLFSYNPYAELRLEVVGM